MITWNQTGYHYSFSSKDETNDTINVKVNGNYRLRISIEEIPGSVNLNHIMECKPNHLTDRRPRQNIDGSEENEIEKASFQISLLVYLAAILLSILLSF